MIVEDPCINCDNLEKRNSFFRRYQDRLSEILKDPASNPHFKHTKETSHKDTTNVNDITAPEQVENDLKSSEDGFKLLYETIFEGICIHDKHVIIDTNQQFADMFGYALDELKGMDCSNLIAPQSKKMIRKYISTGFEGAYESNCLRKDGSTFPAEVRIRKFQKDEKVLRFAVVRDLSSKKEMEHQIIESEKKYRELYNYSPIALYRTRISDGKLLECNQALVELLGYDSKEEFQAASNAILTYVDVNDKTVFMEYLRKNKRVDGFQLQVKRKDGKTIWVECTTEMFPEQDFLEGAMLDITASKLLSMTEKKVLRLIVVGKSNKEIAWILSRSIRTIEDHRSNLMKKLEVDNLAELIKKAKSLKPEAQEK